MRSVDSWFMTDQDLLHTLRSSHVPPEGAYRRLLDAYGEELYRHCILVLGDRDAAHVVLRDTLIVARAHIGHLSDPERLGEWLHALAAAECARHRMRGPGPVVAGLPENTELVRERVLKGMVGPDLDGYRTHVAARADDFGWDGFPRTPGGPEPLLGRSFTLPAVFALIGALLLLAFAGFALFGHGAWGLPPDHGAPQSRR